MASKRGPGRPTKLTEKMLTEIVLLIRAGNYIETAAAAAGISKNTLYEWLRDGARAKTGLKRRFRDEVMQALAMSEILDLQTIRDAAKEEWQAAAWRLERRFPDRWRRRDSTVIEVPGEESHEARRIEEALGEYADAFADFES